MPEDLVASAAAAMFSSLPPNVIHLVCLSLEQKDLLNFALTCREIFETAHPQIYLTIVIDSSKRVFPESDNHAADHHVHFSKHACSSNTPVKIRSLWSLVKFFKVLGKNPQYCRYIRSIVVQNEFPDIPQLDLDLYVASVFPCLERLRFLEWYSVHRPLDARAIYLLPNPSQLQTAGGNFVYYMLENTDVSFPCLKHLDLSNLSTEKSLSKIHLDSFKYIHTLTLSKLVSRNTLEFSPDSMNCCKNAVTEDLADASLLSRTGFTLGSFFESSWNSQNDIDSAPRGPGSAPHGTGLSPLGIDSSPHNIGTPPLGLHSLVLRGFALRAADAALISKKVNFSMLRHLSIDDCSEILFADEPPVAVNFNLVRRNPPASMFLDAVPELPRLELLNINLTNELCFNSCTFRFISRLKGLKKLAVHIKVFQSNEPISLAPLITSLQPHAPTLEYLNVCCDVADNSQYNLVCPRKKNKLVLKTLVGLSSMKRLRSLRLPVSFAQVSKVPDTLSQLQDLRCIHLPITDLATSTAACNSCDKNLVYAISSSNCLVAQDYFDCPSAFNTSVEQRKNDQYINISKDYKKVFSNLQLLRFDFKSESLVYDTSKLRIRLADSLAENFDLIALQV